MRQFGLIAVVCAFVFVAQGCGGPLHYAMRGSEHATGADATLDARIDRDQSRTRLDARVTNLAPPDRIQPGATVFVVWERRNASQPWARLGTLNYDPTSRAGEVLDVNVAETSFDLQVTAESTAQAGSPSNSAVFTQTVGAASN